MNIRPFQLVLIGFFGFMAVGTVIYFGFIWKPDDPIATSPFGGNVEIWGTLDRSVIERVINDFEAEDSRFEVVSYRQVDSSSFNEELLNAAFSGNSPDLILIPHDDLVTYRPNLVSISYETIPERTFRDTYVEGAEIFARPDGIFAIPLVVDPLVMYWNRDMFASAGIANPPTTWEILKSQTTPTLTRRTNSLDILESAVALGEYSNIRNAKEIILLLTIQAGSRMVYESDQGYEVALDRSQDGSRPFATALNFYTEFSNRALATYSWNRAMPEDRARFTSGDLAIYFGFGSEVEEITRLNPNLNFDVAAMPQGGGATALRSYGTFYGFAIPKTADNPSGAYAVANVLSGSSLSSQIAAGLGMAPVRRTLIAQGDPDPFRHVVLEAALIARGWLDPDQDESDAIFRNMIENITSGREKVSEVVIDGVRSLQLSY